MRLKPNESVILLISREKSDSASLTLLDANLDTCFKKIKRIVESEKVSNSDKCNETKLLFREYVYPGGYGKSLSFRTKGLSPDQIKKIIEKQIKKS